MPRFQLGRAKNSSQCRRVRPKRTSIRPKLTSCTSSDKSFSPAACRSRLRTRHEDSQSQKKCQARRPVEVSLLGSVAWRRQSGKRGAPVGAVVHAARQAGRHVGWHRPGSRGNRPKPRNFPCPESARAVLHLSAAASGRADARWPTPPPPPPAGDGGRAGACRPGPGGRSRPAADQQEQ